MSRNPHQVTKDFEAALCEYTGAPYAVAVNSCTMALLLAVAYHFRKVHPRHRHEYNVAGWMNRREVEIPKRTYVGVPMSIIHAGGRPTFRDDQWRGLYDLRPLPVYDAARWFTGGLYQRTSEWDAARRGMILPIMVCVSFHWSKTLGIQQGGAILHDDQEADRWLRMARFDGRQEGVAPKDQKDWIVGHHCYMSPEVAAEGLVRLSFLPKHNDPLPNDDYPDLSTIEVFR